MTAVNTSAPHPASAVGTRARSARAGGASAPGDDQANGLDFAQLLRANTSRATPDTDAETTHAPRTEASDAEPSGASSAVAGVAPPQTPPPQTPTPDIPGAAGLPTAGAEQAAQIAQAGQATRAALGNDPAAGSADDTPGDHPLSALQDALGGASLPAQRRPTGVDVRRASGAATDAAADVAADAAATDKAAARLGVGHLGAGRGEAGEASGTATAPATVPAAAAPERPAWASAPDGSLPSLGAVSTPAPAPATDASAPTTHARLEPPPHSPAFAPALGMQLSTWLRDGVQNARLELNPQTLGPIDVRIAVRDGQTEVALSADVASTRALLSEALPQLAQGLGDVGLSLSGSSVSDQGTERRDAQAGATPTSFGASLRAGGGEAGAEPAAAPVVRRARGLLDLYA